ncbi:MAG: RimK family protein [Planctomycetes bacterium]|nr:RimK family protein [Planctomycetota bacterium]
MRTIVVVHRPNDWPIQVRGIEVVAARAYLTDPAWTKERGVRVFNLCRSYGYQSEGYYVSLLAAARRHRPFPDLRTVLDMKSRHFVRTVDEDLDELIQRSLADIQSDRFELSIYFGKNLAQRHERLARRLFSQFPAPLKRAHFQHTDRWKMTSITPIAYRDVPESHREFVAAAAAEYLGRPRRAPRTPKATRYYLAILHNPDEELRPSNQRALVKFRQAAQHEGFAVEMIRREDYGRLAEFDALFLRETTAVDHHTFRFAQRAESEGLVVIDDPTSILRCTNKVYQAEALQLRGVAMPKTWITDQMDADHVEQTIGLPCVLKHPDSCFSRGVFKASSRAELAEKSDLVLRESDLLVVQEYMPSEFDWRIGVIGGKPLYACRYHMASGHWQIVAKDSKGYRYGRVEPVPLDLVPPRVVRTAIRAAGAIGDGLYGVDLKSVGKRIVVTEVNDNPNLDFGCEDAILGDELYRGIMRYFVDRLNATRGKGTS